VLKRGGESVVMEVWHTHETGACKISDTHSAGFKFAEFCTANVLRLQEFIPPIPSMPRRWLVLENLKPRMFSCDSCSRKEAESSETARMREIARKREREVREGERMEWEPARTREREAKHRHLEHLEREKQKVNYLLYQYYCSGVDVSFSSWRQAVMAEYTYNQTMTDGYAAMPCVQALQRLVAQRIHEDNIRMMERREAERETRYNKLRATGRAMALERKFNIRPSWPYKSGMRKCGDCQKYIIAENIRQISKSKFTHQEYCDIQSWWLDIGKTVPTHASMCLRCIMQCPGCDEFFKLSHAEKFGICFDCHKCQRNG